ncbi:MAG: FG-GAP-like repeat-containing protein [Oligoflexus sp.]
MVLYLYRFILISICALVLSLNFWVGSRYPDLNEKAMMAESASVADTISMWPILEVQAHDPIWKKVAYTTVNWVNDNKKGMTYGVLLASLFLTLINYLQFRQKSSQFLSTFYGFIIGSPLGVCVNCAAPVFKGVLQSRKTEMAFAMMLSSPTMNVIVLTMVFSLFPFYMAITKVLFTLAIIFLGVPIIARVLGPNHKIIDWEKVDAGLEKLSQPPKEAVKESIWQALIGTLVDFGRSFRYMLVRTVPLMFVAGFLGSLVSHVIPLDMMMGKASIGIMLVTGLVGIILPTPMAFDIILTNALFTAGLAPSLAVILLCTLGIYSSYSFMITWTSASKQWALSLSGAIYVIAVLLGIGTPWMHESFYIQSNIREYQKQLALVERGGGAASMEEDDSSEAPPTVSNLLQEAKTVFENEQVKIRSIPFQKTDPAKGKFEPLEGQEIGLGRGFTYGIRDYPDPFWIGRGTGAADYNQDGWVDIAFGSNEGIYLYRNQAGTYVRDRSLPKEIKKFRVYAVAFVDWNNNGWLDLFFTTFNRGNYVVINEHGKWSEELIKVPNGGGILTVAPSFADFDGDGRLDVFNGNMALGVITGFQKYGKGRADSVTFQREQGFEEYHFKTLDGETMASLAADFNGDGHIDIYVSHDFIVPDFLYLGDGTGKFQVAGEDLKSQLTSPFFAMSIDTADLNNDLIPDIVTTGTTTVLPGTGQRPIDGRSPELYTNPFDKVDDCLNHIRDEYYQNNCVINRRADILLDFNKNRTHLSIDDCQKIDDKHQKEECLLSVMWQIVTNHAQIQDCQKQFGFDAHIVEVCEIYRKRGPQYQSAEFKNHITQQNNSFVFLAQKDGSLKRADFAHPGGWTWNTKVADLDNDGFQDIFNAEGAVRMGEYGFNVLMRNNQGQSFEQKQFSWNLDNPFYLFSSSFVDFNHSGQLDIIGNSSLGPVQVYKNRVTDNQSIAFAVRQAGSNTHGLHSKIVIHDAKGQKQMREFKAGGGYQSFDPYRAYFGLKDVTTIHQLEITGLNSEPVRIEHELPAGSLYIVEFKD